MRWCSSRVIAPAHPHTARARGTRHFYRSRTAPRKRPPSRAVRIGLPTLQGVQCVQRCGPSGLPLGNQVLQRYSLRKVSTLIRYGTFSSIVATTKCRGYRVDKHIEMGPLGRRCWQKVVRYGFKNEIDLPRGLEHVRSWGCQMEPVTTRYFSSRDVVIPTSGTGMAS